MYAHNMFCLAHTKMLLVWKINTILSKQYSFLTTMKETD